MITGEIVGIGALVIVLVLGGFVIGLIVGSSIATDKVGQVACQSINKTWALIDGQYMCVTVTP